MSLKVIWVWIHMFSSVLGKPVWISRLETAALTTHWLRCEPFLETSCHCNKSLYEPCRVSTPREVATTSLWNGLEGVFMNVFIAFCGSCQFKTGSVGFSLSDNSAHLNKPPALRIRYSLVLQFFFLLNTFVIVMFLGGALSKVSETFGKQSWILIGSIFSSLPSLSFDKMDDWSTFWCFRSLLLWGASSFCVN